MRKEEKEMLMITPDGRSILQRKGKEGERMKLLVHDLWLSFFMFHQKMQVAYFDYWRNVKDIFSEVN